MVLVPKCDRCDEIYKGGFQSSLKKVIVFGKKEFNVEVSIRPPHLCGKCFKKIMTEVLKK